MSNINASNTLSFKSTDALFARVRKRLKSYDAAGLIDEGDFYYWIKEMIEQLGVSVYQEHKAVIEICDFKGGLPENFAYLYAAYKCTPSEVDTGSKQTVFPQTGFVFYTEETHEPYRKCKSCYAAKIDYVHGDKVTIRTYIEGQPIVRNFTSPTLLSLSKNVKGICDEKCANLFANCPHEIQIDKPFIYTNFNNDSIYMEYFGIATDPESGLPMIPDNTFIEKCIEDYLIYNIFLELWYNGSAPDIQGKFELAKLNWENSLKAAMYWVKMPSFQKSIDTIRFNRKNLSIYQQTGYTHNRAY